ncbi:MAG TPA: hypothetical protein VF736_03015 [Pyrinomonadaceae bacterium]|jgi:hypothetical protein
MQEEDVTTRARANGEAAKAAPGEPKTQAGGASGDRAPKGTARQPRDARAGEGLRNPDDEPEPDLLDLLRGRQDEFLACLARPSWAQKLWRKATKRTPPELLKVYGIIYNHLGEVQRLLAERAAAPPQGFDRVERHLRTLLGNSYEHSRSVNVHAAWEFAGALERVLLLLGDDDYLLTRLESERERVRQKPVGSWGQYLAVEKLDKLLEQYRGGGGDAGRRARAVESLAYLSVRRSAFERSRRAREELKADYLNRLTFVLTLLLLLLLEAVYIASAEGDGRFSQSLTGFFQMVRSLDLKLDLSSNVVRSALVAAMTGALGSTLSGFYKLRDETGGIATLRSFRSAMWAQPFVGATVGVLLMLLLMSGVLALGTGGGPPKPAWLSLAVYCFFAGFSEPFFLGVVQRVAGAADKKAPSADVATPGGASAAAGAGEGAGGNAH